MFFAKADQSVGESIHWVDTTRYLGVTLDKLLIWSPHVFQARKNAARRPGVLGPVLNRRLTAI